MSMGWKKAWTLTLLLPWLTACSVVLGDHPFSDLPKSSGKLDHTPEVFIARGEADTVCMNPPSLEVDLHFFITLRWMKPQEITIWTGGSRPAEPVQMQGDHASVLVHAKGASGMLSYHMLTVEVAGKQYQTTTIVADCRGASAGSVWSPSATVSTSARSAAGS